MKVGQYQSDEYGGIYSVLVWNSLFCYQIYIETAKSFIYEVNNKYEYETEKGKDTLRRI